MGCEPAGRINSNNKASSIREMQLRGASRPSCAVRSRHARPFGVLAPRPQHGVRQQPARAAELESVVSVAQDGPSALLGAVALVPLIGFAAYRLYAYSQMEYITAAMLSRHVPKDAPGPVVVQVGGGTKELYYYPKNTLQVTVVGENVNKSLMEQAGMQAAVPTLAKVQSPSSLRFAENGSVDTVVSLGAVGKLGKAAATSFLSEAARVLKPGRRLVFVEQDEATLFSILESQQSLWDDVEYDKALGGPDTRVVGVAIRGSRAVGQSGGTEAESTPAASAAKRRAKAKAKDDGKGFT